MNFKRLICKIFGHRLEEMEYYSEEYVTTSGNHQRGLRKTTKKHGKKKVVREYRMCKRCGAMIMVNEYKKTR